MKKEYFFLAQVKNETIEVSAIANSKQEAHKKAKTALRKNFKKAKLLNLLRVEKLGKKEAKVKKDKKVVSSKKTAEKEVAIKKEEVVMTKTEKVVAVGKDVAVKSIAFVGGLFVAVKTEIEKPENKAKVEKAKETVAKTVKKVKEEAPVIAGKAVEGTKKVVDVSRAGLSEFFYNVADFMKVDDKD